MSTICQKSNKKKKWLFAIKTTIDGLQLESREKVKKVEYTYGKNLE